MIMENTPEQELVNLIFEVQAGLDGTTVWNEEKYKLLCKTLGSYANEVLDKIYKTEMSKRKIYQLCDYINPYILLDPEMCYNLIRKMTFEEFKNEPDKLSKLRARYADRIYSGTTKASKAGGGVF